MSTKTKPRSLEDLFAAVAEAGYPLTEQERDIARRRLARNGKYQGRPDPLSGTESDPVEAVDHLYDERGAALARHIDGPPPIRELLGLEAPEPSKTEEEEALSAAEQEIARLREELARVSAVGPAGVDRIEQVTESSAGPLERDTGSQEPTPSALIEPIPDPPETKKGRS